MYAKVASENDGIVEADLIKDENNMVVEHFKKEIDEVLSGVAVELADGCSGVSSFRVLHYVEQ